MSSIRNLSTKEIRKHYTYDSEDKQHYESWGFEFDRWLAEVKAEVWEEGLYAGAADSYFGYPDNPYRQVGDL